MIKYAKSTVVPTVPWDSYQEGTVEASKVNLTVYKNPQEKTELDVHEMHQAICEKCQIDVWPMV